jgi:hypothetical protein
MTETNASNAPARASNATARASNATARASNATAKPASNATAKPASNATAKPASNATATPPWEAAYNAAMAADVAAGALCAAFITFHMAEGENEKHLRVALKANAGNIDLKPLARGIILSGGAAWCKENANAMGAAFFNRTIDAAKEAADEMGLENAARKAFMNPLRAKIQRAIIALSGIDPKAVKASAGTAKPKDKAARAGAPNEPRPDASESDTDERAETVRHKIEHAALMLALETVKRLAVAKTAADRRDLAATIATLESLAA